MEFDLASINLVNAAKFSLIVLWDIILSGDNALVIGMAAAVLAPHLRRKAIIFGLILATVIRIAAAIVATKLLNIPWILVVGGLLLFWVSWRLYQDIKDGLDIHAVDDGGEGGTTDRKAVMKALFTITVADISMSIDNVLAVAATARGSVFLLVFGLALSIAMMGLMSGFIVKILHRYPWISWVGLVLLILLGCTMVYEGIHKMMALH